MSQVFPKAFVNAGVKKEPVAEQVTARIDMSADVAGAGLCPECKQPMEKTHANGMPVLACQPCRITIPIKD